MPMKLPSRRWMRAFFSADRFLLLALAAALLSGIQGVNWGRYGCMNPDEMAAGGLKSNPPLHPGRFDKPPFFTYLNKFLVNEPIRTVSEAECQQSSPPSAPVVFPVAANLFLRGDYCLRIPFCA